MAQRLILPINVAKITASYKNTNYKNQFKFTHFGTDIIGSPTSIYASGNGTVTQCGFDKTFGNVVIVVYDTAIIASTGVERQLAMRYFHLSKISVKVAQRVDKDTILGVMGNTGAYSIGTHLHIEVDTDIANPSYSPSGSGTIIKLGTDTTLNPMTVLWAKTSAPDNQSITGQIQLVNSCVTSGEAGNVKKTDVTFINPAPTPPVVVPPVVIPTPVVIDPKDTLIADLKTKNSELTVKNEADRVVWNKEREGLIAENNALKFKIITAINNLK